MNARWSRANWPLLVALLIVFVAACGRAPASAQPAQPLDAPAVVYAEAPFAEATTDAALPPEPSAAPHEAAPQQEVAAASAPPAQTALKPLKPNEMGKIMVLEYHVIGDEEDRWTRTRENFRSDLEYLYSHDYYLIGLNELLKNRVNVPAGKTPVVITFDDSNRSQFQATAAADETVTPDPTSGLGILEGFIADHPDFGRAAVFCVLPGADPPNDLFGQPDLRAAKLRYLAQNGYEICNHTLWHGTLSEETPEEATELIAKAQKVIQDAVPGYQVTVFDPPHGIYADDLSTMTDGTFEGTTYHHSVILEVGSGPMTAPDDRNTDWMHVARMQAIPEVLDEYLPYFEQHPEERYVSDGDPNQVTFPTERLRDYVPSAGAQEVESQDPGYTVMKLR